MTGTRTLSPPTDVPILARLRSRLPRFFTRSLAQYKGIIFIVAIAVIFAPQVSPSDHELNIEPLRNLNRVYENPAYVYPPQALTLMMPFVFIGASLTRFLTVFIIAAYGISRDWTVYRFMLTILNPIFVYVMMFTNIDIFIVLLPLLFFDRVNIVGKALFLSLLMLKPQMTILYVLYLVIHHRAWWAAILGAFFTLAQCAILDPDGHYLILGWVDNILNPTAFNAAAWGNNQSGVRWLVFAIFPLAYYFQRKNWTRDYTIATLLIFSMTISPYASFQSVLVAVTMMGGGLVMLIHWGLVIAGIGSADWYTISTLLLGNFSILLPRVIKSPAKESTEPHRRAAAI